ncbi:ketosynthase chain-length factor [Amycolatopsis cihanbeyliensis]|uniref:Act minimal PKS chain-length factor (CLF/KS beta) n=1 Tax=Amycolatopsis cihanbeyliensis TaxID=1128664 RepID=A0A542DBT7_AMYCI|nr:ketosynthase chain-length factor [Amycolatopsis cihanbeyliensis]TQJ00525.1 act minimal PKS chain-length factor (CLF/KS beta) [Amycolatopsis cihanbeyliensis]
MSGRPRVVVTGLGAVAPNGIGIDRYWKAVLEGRVGLNRLTGYDSSVYPARVAGQVLDFDAEQHVPGRLLPQTDRVTRLALPAAEEALVDAGVDPSGFPEYGMGVVTSNAMGGFEFTHTEVNKLWNNGPEHVSVYESFAWFYAVNTGQISIRYGMRGPSGVVVAEQAGGLDAIGHARRTILAGSTLAVTGGVESALDPWGWVCHLSTGRVSTEPDPGLAYRPFHAEAGGYVPGEGGAILVLEEESAARARGAEPCGEIAGYAATFDPPPGSTRPPGLARAARAAITDAGMVPAEIDMVFADAAGIPERDRLESAAIEQVFGPAGVPVTAPKAAFGRLSAGGPPLDVAAALLALRDQVIPPSGPVDSPAYQHRMDLVCRRGRGAPVRSALVLARGHGGFNAALVVRATN